MLAGSMLEELKERIHNFRIPIRSPRVLLAVKTIYFFTPVVVGYFVMQAVVPDPEAVKAKMLPPSDYAVEKTERQKRNLQAALDQAQAQARTTNAQN